MKPRKLQQIVAILLAVTFVGVSMAERPSEDRSIADYVLTGKVTAVYRRDHFDYANYIVEMRVESVTKGKNIKPGEIFRAYCFQRHPGQFSPGASGHDVVPKENSKVRVFVKRENGQNEGVYSDWVDVLKN
ncbi:hypothetical protein LOC68_27610 [Blastopirellula sp. JC732]|uniref:Uncharacterized protein n=1 Tax=Blastopirellula sediminis TaxID=2894196 RepID=A0A9X1MTM1_9BACT|nr:hypothetical protein [Blastopirellula sediminis]MCC9604521.1 hypothetical protein [Blastopirellula sediminis]MCC9632180.1 hypothetical protein [Blastopirellula sediminis]